ncbi:hypothetical protein BJV74DRAFT_75103 [Russula compacta]|nr:hypothetical protein BJV74DRAFT_75103 [Russula compacta]
MTWRGRRTMRGEQAACVVAFSRGTGVADALRFFLVFGISVARFVDRAPGKMLCRTADQTGLCYHGPSQISSGPHQSRSTLRGTGANRRPVQTAHPMTTTTTQRPTPTRSPPYRTTGDWTGGAWAASCAREASARTHGGARDGSGSAATT